MPDLPGPAAPRFVVQHHLATADHYDFRLEIDGVLVSWAVPKGPSIEPGVRRMAKRTGDHALEYASFEGVLSTVRRGGGTVQLWDAGTFRNASHVRDTPVTAADGLAGGHLSFVLAGHKLRGGYSLIRTGGDDLWLLIRKRDADADTVPPGPLDRSVLTGRTLAEIDAEGTRPSRAGPGP